MKKLIFAVAVIVVALSSCANKFGCYQSKSGGVIHRPLHRY
jgi:hypothetical protein